MKRLICLFLFLAITMVFVTVHVIAIGEQITFGKIEPTAPPTYDYIKVGMELSNNHPNEHEEISVTIPSTDNLLALSRLLDVPMEDILAVRSEQEKSTPQEDDSCGVDHIDAMEERYSSRLK